MTTAPRAFIVGHPIGHSRSPLIHGFWLKLHGIAGSYEKVAVEPYALPGFIDGLRAADYVGGNVTVPHKTEVLALADHADEVARAVGAANTLWFENGKLLAGNTDASGFLASLDAEAPGWDRDAARAVVLGAGGAARAVVFGLLRRGFSVDVVNRSRARAEALARDFGIEVAPHDTRDLASRLGAAGVFVNTTSLGMEGQPPLELDLRALPPDALVADIVYAPLETTLLRDARARGQRAVGGLGMLLHQAVPGFERWFGVRPDVTPALRALVEADVARSAS